MQTFHRANFEVRVISVICADIREFGKALYLEFMIILVTTKKGLRQIMQLRNLFVIRFEASPSLDN